MFDNVSKEERVETTWHAVVGRPKILRCECSKTTRSRHLHHLRIVVDANAMSVEVFQISAESASDVEREAWLQPTEVPAVGSLDAQGVLPSDELESCKPDSILTVARIAGGLRSRSRFLSLRHRRLRPRKLKRKLVRTICPPRHRAPTAGIAVRSVVCASRVPKPALDQ